MSAKKETSVDSPLLSLEQRLIKCREAVSFVLKDVKKVNNQYNPITYNDVASKCKPELLAHGVGLWFSVTKADIRPQIKSGKGEGGALIEYVAGYFCDLEVEVAVVNVDAPGDNRTFSVFVTSWDTLDKGPLKAYTAARKQAYIALFQLETYEEGDAPKEIQAQVEPALYTRINEFQISELRKLGAKIQISEDIIAKAADPSFERLEQIPVAKYEEIQTRLSKRAAQLEGGAK